jgi:uncharacterized RDD family membrane protein YckC
VTRQPFARLGAWLVDVLCISGWVAVLAVTGTTLYFTGVVHDVSGNVGNDVSFVVLILPATVTMAWYESSSREATIGKRARGLRVVDAGTGSRVSFGRALLRNALKIAVPREVGHTVAYGLVGTARGGAIPVWLVVATVAAYLVPTVYLATLFVGHGRTPYDWLSGTVVIGGRPELALEVL